MIFRQVPWSLRVQQSLQVSLGKDLEFVRAEVLSNISQVWSINGGESFMVCRRELDTLVIVAFEGTKLAEVAPEIIARARANGCRDIRFHTQRPALIRLLREYNPEPIEYVMRIRLTKEH